VRDRVELGSRGGDPGPGRRAGCVTQLEALFTRTFSIGLDVGRGREKVALVRLRLSKALLGASSPEHPHHCRPSGRWRADWTGIKEPGEAESRRHPIFG
jgi:hypothetical protein